MVLILKLQWVATVMALRFSTFHSYGGIVQKANFRLMGKGFHAKVLKDGDAVVQHHSSSVPSLLSVALRESVPEKESFLQ